MNLDTLIDLTDIKAVRELLKAAALNGGFDNLEHEAAKHLLRRMLNGGAAPAPKRAAKAKNGNGSSPKKPARKAKNGDPSAQTKKSAVDQEALVKLAEQKGALARSVVISRFACSPQQASAALAKAVEDGALFSAGSRRWTRYATTQKAADAAVEKE